MLRNVKTAAILTAILSSPAFAETGDMSIGVGGGLTQGMGLELSYELNQNIDLRGIYYKGSMSQSELIDDINFETSIEANTPGVMVDFFPTEGRSFRLTAGIVMNGNELNAKATPAGTYDIGGSTYLGSEVGSLNATVDFQDVAPYVGMGYNLVSTENFALGIEGGVLFQGSPKVTMTADGTSANDPAFQAELEAERKKAEDELSDFEYLPVAKITLSYRF